MPVCISTVQAGWHKYPLNRKQIYTEGLSEQYEVVVKEKRQKLRLRSQDLFKNLQVRKFLAVLQFRRDF
jgi:ribosome-binding protein aMBF1 (putative translation factor)